MLAVVFEEQVCQVRDWTLFALRAVQNRRVVRAASKLSRDCAAIMADEDFGSVQALGKTGASIQHDCLPAGLDQELAPAEEMVDFDEIRTKAQEDVLGRV